MDEPLLTAFWIRSPVSHAPIGFGVTAWDLDDALRIIRAFDYGRFLPDDTASLQVIRGVKVAALDHKHVIHNMGPINTRGMWYPFVAVGIPSWAAERLNNA